MIHIIEYTENTCSGVDSEIESDDDKGHVCAEW